MVELNEKISPLMKNAMDMDRQLAISFIITFMNFLTTKDLDIIRRMILLNVQKPEMIDNEE